MRHRGIWLIVTLLLIAGCASQQVLADGKAAVGKAIVKPVMGFAIEDAQTTIAWINEQVRVNRLSAVDAEQARRCPRAVLSVAELRELFETGAAVEGRKGLIYLGTVSRFGGPTMERELRGKLAELIAACGELVPADRFLPYLR